MATLATKEWLPIEYMVYIGGRTDSANRVISSIALADRDASRSFKKATSRSTVDQQQHTINRQAH